ncbi:hypothetical protein GCM10028783_30290 [Modestobacter muralis]
MPPTRVRLRRVRTEQRWTWVDLRLVPAAGTVWLLTLAAPHLPVRVLLATAVGAALGGGVALALGRRGSGAGASVLVACLAAVTLAGAASAARGHERAVSPLAGLGDRQATVPVALELDDDPRLLAGAGFPRVLVRGSVVEADGQPLGGDPVLLFGPAEEWAGLLPGQTVRLRATVRPAEPGDEVWAVLSARSPPEPAGGPGPAQDAAGALRGGLAESAARTLPARPAGLLPGLVVGDTTAMDPALTAEFRRAGLAHLTAVSGDSASCQPLVCVCARRPLHASLIRPERPGPVRRRAGSGVPGGLRAQRLDGRRGVQRQRPQRVPVRHEGPAAVPPADRVRGGAQLRRPGHVGGVAGSA